jgi:hypothetical protein
MSTKPNRQKLLIILAGSAVGLFILNSVLFSPLYDLWKAHSTEIVKLRKEVADGNDLIARAAQRQRTWSEMEAGALPKEPSQAEQDLISAFDRWASASRVELGSIKPVMKKGATDKYSLLECRVDAIGTFSTLSRFLYEVEKSPLALRIESVELAARDEVGQKLSLGLIVTGLRLYPYVEERQ